MLEGSSVIVIVPAFQEQQQIARVIETMPAFVDMIVVVDDGSQDETTERARHASDTRTVLIKHAKRRGVGAAIATGYQEAIARNAHGRPTDALCIMAGDGQMHPNDLRSVALPIVLGAADYVKGDRFRIEGVRKAMGWPRWVGGTVFSFLTSLAIGQAISDSQCGFTALSRAAATRLDLVGLWPSFGYPNDILGQLAAKRLRIREVPVMPIYGTEQSKLRLRHLPPIFYLVARAAMRRRTAWHAK